MTEKGQTKLTWQKKRQKNDKKNEMTKKRQKKKKKWQTKLKWQKTMTEKMTKNDKINIWTISRVWLRVSSKLKSLFTFSFSGMCSKGILIFIYTKRSIINSLIAIIEPQELLFSIPLEPHNLLFISMATTKEIWRETENGILGKQKYFSWSSEFLLSNRTNRNQYTHSVSWKKTPNA